MSVKRKKKRRTNPNNKKLIPAAVVTNGSAEETTTTDAIAENPVETGAEAAAPVEMVAAETVPSTHAPAVQAPVAPDDVIEIVDLPEDPLAEEAIKQIEGIAETSAASTADTAADAVAAEECAAENAARGEEAPVDDAEVSSEAALEQTATEVVPEGTTVMTEADKPRKRIPVWGKVLIGIAAVLVVILGIGVGIVGHFLSRIGRASDEDYVAVTEESLNNEETSASNGEEETDPLNTMDPDDITWYGQSIEPMQDDDIKNILLIGQDRREGDSKSELKRSDAMVIISLNQVTGKIKVCSLMRDMYVQIPGYGGNKLNYSYEKGGMELLDQTIEENLGVTIDNNVEVDFDGFVEAMSVIGNLDIYLSQAEIDFMEAHPTWADDSGADVTTWDLHEGLNSMKPSEYAVFCRLRMIGNNDFERTERQRRVLSAAFNKVLEGGVFNMLGVANAIIPYITTDMTNGEILGYVYTVVTKGMELSGQYRIPLDNTWTNQTINRAAVLVCDMETNTRALQEFLYGDEEGVEFKSEEDRAQEKESGTFTTDRYGTSGSSSYGGYSGTGSTGSTTSTAPVTTEVITTDPDTVVVTDGTDMTGVPDTAGMTETTDVTGSALSYGTDPAASVVVDPSAYGTTTDTTVTTDPAATGVTDGTIVADPAGAISDPAADITGETVEDETAAAQAAAEQAAAAQALAEQMAAAQAAAAQAAAEQAAAAQAATATQSADALTGQ